VVVVVVVVVINIYILKLRAVKKCGSNRIHFYDPLLMMSPALLTGNLNCILLLDYKCTLPDISITRSVGLRVCITGK